MQYKLAWLDIIVSYIISIHILKSYLNQELGGYDKATKAIGETRFEMTNKEWV